MGGQGNPLVTVVIPAWNSAATISETLQSVAGQTYRDLEILIVDDGSTDNSAAIAEDFCRTDARARLLRQPNRGVAAARNRGIGEARGDWIAPIDADDLWHPDKIGKQINAALAAPVTPGFVYCWFHYIDAQGLAVGSSAEWVASGYALQQLACHNFVGNGSAPLLLRSAVESVGGYDEGLKARNAEGCADQLLQLLIARDYPVVAVSEHLVGYRVQPGSMSRDNANMALSWELTYDRLRRECPQVPERSINWMLGMRYVEFGLAKIATSSRWLGLRQVGHGLRIDPLRCGAYLFYRLVRLGARLVRGSRTPERRRHFYETSPTERLRVDKDEVRWLADMIERFDNRRLARLAALERRTNGEGAQ